MNKSDSHPEGPAVEISHLTRRFGNRDGLIDVSIRVPAGLVFGIIGENGAGKTTLIKHVLGLLRPQSGFVRVLGKDPVADPVGTLSQIGFYSEESNLPDWMTVDEQMRFQRAFFPTWDTEYAEHLRSEFDLDGSVKIKNISRGARAKLGLLIALAHRPKLLVLDEPSSGLDPLARTGILEAVIRSIAEEGRTVLFCSHLLGEIERVADSVAMLSAGKIVLCENLDAIKESHHRLVMRFESIQKSFPALETSLSAVGSGHEWTVICNGNINEIREHAVHTGARIVEENIPSLDEIFIARAVHARKEEQRSSAKS